MRVCDGTCDTCDCEIWTEPLVTCDYCRERVPLSEVIDLGENVGPDLLGYSVYICADCAEELDEYEDE
jgi:hypothetical protein